MWRAFTKDGEHLFEGKHGRPVELGNEGGLIAIAEEEHHHNVMVLLETGKIIIGYHGFDFGLNEKREPSLQINLSPQTTVLDICEETLIVNDLKHIERIGPDKDGWYSDIEKPVIWRPIWFTRQFPMQGRSIKVIGAQTTLPDTYGGQNVKKLVMLFDDGRIGIS